MCRQNIHLSEARGRTLTKFRWRGVILAKFVRDQCRRRAPVWRRAFADDGRLDDQARVPQLSRVRPTAAVIDQSMDEAVGTWPRTFYAGSRC